MESLSSSSTATTAGTVDLEKGGVAVEALEPAHVAEVYVYDMVRTNDNERLSRLR
jgi:molybdenum cofactor biosynthesis enzyme